MIDHTVAQVCALFVSSSSPCLMRTLSDSLSDLSIHLTFLLFIFPLSSCTSYCRSPHSSSLMSWTTTTRTAAEELGHPDNKNSSTIWWGWDRCKFNASLQCDSDSDSLSRPTLLWLHWSLILFLWCRTLECSVSQRVQHPIWGRAGAWASRKSVKGKRRDDEKLGEDGDTLVRSRFVAQQFCLGGPRRRMCKHTTAWRRAAWQYCSRPASSATALDHRDPRHHRRPLPRGRHHSVKTKKHRLQATTSPVRDPEGFYAKESDSGREPES